MALVAHGVHDHGGMERACAELIRRTSDRYVFVVVAADVDSEIRALAEECVEIRVPRRPMPLRLATFFVKGGWALRRVQADLVHTVGAIVPNRADIASVHFCHAGYREAVGFAGPRQPSLARRASGILARWEARLLERWCYRPARLRALAAVSRGVAGEAARHFPGLPVAVTSNGVDTERFRPSSPVRAEIRAETGTGEGEVVALFVGGDWRRKGLELAIGGLADAASAGADLHLWVVGPGDEAAFHRIAERSGVAARVTFFGPRDDTARFYQAADLFVLPSAYETFSIASFEAAACGLPLVVTPLHGAGELAGDDGRGGGLVVERTAASVGAAFARLARDEALRKRLGAEAQRRAAAYSWERSAEAVARLYEELLERAPAPQAGRCDRGRRQRPPNRQRPPDRRRNRMRPRRPMEHRESIETMETPETARQARETLLFVCTGNVCRSPMAQAVAISLLERRGVPVGVLSAGTMHTGLPPMPRAEWAMRRRGLDVTGYRSRGLEEALDPPPDLILAMCREHARAVIDLRPDLFERTFTLKDFVRRAREEGARRRTEDLASFVDRLQLGRKPWDLRGSEPEDDVADPMGRRRRFYERCAAEIDGLVSSLVDLTWPLRPTR